MGFTIKMDLPDEMLDQIAEKVISKVKLDKLSSKPVNETVYTVKEVADKLHTNELLIRTHIRAGILTAHRPGKSYLITQINLNNYIHGRNL